MNATLQRATSLMFLIVVAPQPVPVLRLSAPQAQYPEPFTRVGGVRELRDGRVIVLDAPERSVLLVDLKSGSSAKVGRPGPGPGEYELPLSLVALPGDSSAIVDMARASGPIVVTPQGKSGSILPLPDSAPGGQYWTTHNETDARGLIYSQLPPGVVPSGGCPDSAGIERADRRTGRRQIVACISQRSSGAPLSTAPTRPAAAEARGVRAPRPFTTLDQWAAAPDGRVAIVTAQPYRVAFVDDKGVRSLGPLLVVEQVPVTEGHKKAWREEHQRKVPTVRRNGDGQLSYGYSAPPLHGEPEDWPKFLPPFVAAFSERVARFAPDGTLWILRTAPADAPPTFDLINRAGQIAARLILPPHTRLVGFGSDTVYLVRIDDDDLEHLQRFALPRPT